MQRPYYFVMCSYAQQKMIDEAQEWFVKAKLNNELPPFDEMVANENLNSLTKYAFFSSYDVFLFLIFLDF